METPPPRFYPGPAPAAAAAQSQFLNVLTIVFLLAALSVLLMLVICYLTGWARARERRRVHGGGGRHRRVTGSELARSGWIVYYMTGCGHCVRQQKLVGAMPGRTIEVSTTAVPGSIVIVKSLAAPTGPGEKAPVPVASVPAYPFWFNLKTGEKRTGFQDEASLQEMAD
jgi:hypothetical protein